MRIGADSPPTVPRPSPTRNGYSRTRYSHSPDRLTMRQSGSFGSTSSGNRRWRIAARTLPVRSTVPPWPCDEADRIPMRGRGFGRVSYVLSAGVGRIESGGWAPRAGVGQEAYPRARVGLRTRPWTGPSRDPIRPSFDPGVGLAVPWNRSGPSPCRGAPPFPGAVLASQPLWDTCCRRARGPASPFARERVPGHQRPPTIPRASGTLPLESAKC